MKTGSRDSWWVHLLQNARKHPFVTWLVVFSIIMVLPVIFGIATSTRHWLSISGLSWSPVGFEAVIDHGTVITGWISVAAAWALGLLAWARRKEMGHRYKNPGTVVHELAGTFQGSLILGSRHLAQPGWHLHNLRPHYCDVVWTDATYETTKKLMDDLSDSNIEFLHPVEQGLHKLDDVNDIVKVREHCKRLLGSLIDEVQDRRRVCLDLTAGNTVMSLGAFQAGEEMQVTTIYLLGNQLGPNGNPIINEQNITHRDEAKVIIISDHRDT